MLVIPAFFALVAGRIRGGKFRNIANLPLRKTYLLYAALLLQVLALNGFAGPWAPPLVIISYLLLLFSLAVNLHLPGMYAILIGTFLNALVVSLNGGQMPVALEQLGLPLRSEMITAVKGKHTLLTESTVFPLLSDIIPVRIHLLSYYRLYSIGDIFQMAGVFLLLQKGMLMPRQGKRVVVESDKHKNRFYK